VYFDSNIQPSAGARVQVGIDAAVVARHHVCVRAFTADGRVSVSRFQVPPTLTGLATLTKRLSPYPGVLAWPSRHR
jgi:alkanesulfonate monooxygenase SsuD/methylene tetrahydromethanopterin reductase-like flavin-dependent oxidoreductase (luciferase family)